MEKIINKQYSGPYVKRNAWWSHELQQLQFKIITLLHKIRTENNQGDLILLKYARQQFKSKKTEDKRMFADKKAWQLTCAYKKGQNDMWKEVKKQSARKTELTVGLKEVEKHYKRQLEDTINTESNWEFDAHVKLEVDEYVGQIKKEKGEVEVCPYEILDIIKKLKNSKAVGYLGISNEMIKYSKSKDITLILKSLFETAINEGVMPQSMNIGVLKPIIKDVKGSTSDVQGNTRPITISDVIATIWEQYLKIRLKGMKTNAHQFGFKAGSSTSHAIFIQKENIKYAQDNREVLYTTYVDFSKAFDKLHRDKMMIKLKPYLDPHVWLALKNYYDIGIVRVYIKGEGYGEPIKPRMGVKQGGPCSTDIFLKYIDLLLDILENSGLLFNIEGCITGLTSYADDTKVTTNKLENVQKIMGIIEEYCLKYNIMVNGTKTEWMKLGEVPLMNSRTKGISPRPTYLTENFTLGGVHIKKVSHFKFLGMWLMSNGKEKIHVRKRLAAAYAGLADLKNIGYFNRNLDIKIKANFTHAFIRSRIMSNMENASYTVKEINSLISMEGTQLKKSLGLEKNDHMTLLYHAMEMDTLEMAIEKRKITFMMQLVENETTRELISRLRNQSIVKNTLDLIGYNNKNESKHDVAHNIFLLCKKKLVVIAKAAKLLRNDSKTLIIRHLLNNRNTDNYNTLKYLLSPLGSFG